MQKRLDKILAIVYNDNLFDEQSSKEMSYVRLKRALHGVEGALFFVPPNSLAFLLCKIVL